jgi:hypothetical protein
MYSAKLSQSFVRLEHEKMLEAMAPRRTDTGVYSIHLETDYGKKLASRILTIQQQAFRKMLLGTKPS